MSTDRWFRRLRAVAMVVAISLMSTVGLQAAHATPGAQLWVARSDGLFRTAEEAASNRGYWIIPADDKERHNFDTSEAS
jgi:hypothetical protein